MDLLEQDRTAFMYGVTRRPGIEVTVPVSPEDQAAWATGYGLLGTGRGFGGGDLDERVVRGIVFARLADFVEGNAKARPLVAERIAALLDGPLPKVPLDGQAGAGEILPMMHVMSETYTGDFEEGEWMTLVNGSPCSAALVADTALHARHRLENAETVFALSSRRCAPRSRPTIRPLIFSGATSTRPPPCSGFEGTWRAPRPQTASPSKRR